MPAKRATRLYRLNTIIIAGIIIAIAGSVLALAAAQIWVDHTQNVTAKFTRLLFDQADLSAARSSYLLTGNKSFLEPCNYARKDLYVTLDKLIELTRDNRNQQDRLSRLKSLLKQMVALNDKSIVAYQSSSILHTESGQNLVCIKELADQYKTLCSDGLNEETSLLRKRTYRANIWNALTLVSILTLSLLALRLCRNLHTAMKDALASERDASEKVINSYREDFMAALAHDLKIPVIASQRIYGLLLDEILGPLTEQQRSIIKSLDKSNEEQLQLILRLLQVYRYEGKTESMLLSNTDLSQLVKQCLCNYTHRDNVARIEFADDLTDQEVSCDAVAIRMLVNNLVDNALKHTPKDGTVKVVLTRDNSAVVFSVTDTGCGFSPEHQKMMFQQFWQGPATRQYSASIGLGLYLCKQIVTGHGGQITCSSVPDEGSTFTATLPLKICCTGKPQHLVVALS